MMPVPVEPPIVMVLAAELVLVPIVMVGVPADDVPTSRLRLPAVPDVVLPVITLSAPELPLVEPPAPVVRVMVPPTPVADGVPPVMATAPPLLAADPWLVPPCRVRLPPTDPVVALEPAPPWTVTELPAAPAAELPVPWILTAAVGEALVPPVLALPRNRLELVSKKARAVLLVSICRPKASLVPSTPTAVKEFPFWMKP